MRYENFILPLLCASALATPVLHVEKVVIEERALCNADNCLRALIRFMSASHQDFCRTFDQVPLPSALSTCTGTRLPSACSCVFTSTIANSTSIPTHTSTRSNSTITSSHSSSLKSTATSTTRSNSTTTHIHTYSSSLNSTVTATRTYSSSSTVTSIHSSSLNTTVTSTHSSSFNSTVTSTPTRSSGSTVASTHSSSFNSTVTSTPTRSSNSTVTSTHSSSLNSTATSTHSSSLNSTATSTHSSSLNSTATSTHSSSLNSTATSTHSSSLNSTATSTHSSSLNSTATSTHSSTVVTTSISTTSSVISQPPCTTRTGTPTVVLTHPTPIVGVVGGVLPDNLDDNNFAVTLPFPITFYNVTTTDIFVSINGFISLKGAIPSTGNPSYANGPLPQFGNEFNQMPDTSIAIFWDDLFLFKNTSQGIFFEVDGNSPKRVLHIEWFASHYQDPTQFYHFIMTYQEIVPNSITFSYYDISDNGLFATVGAQSQTSNIFSQFSFDQAVIRPGTVLTFNSTANAFRLISTCL